MIENSIDLNDLIGKPFSEDGYGPDSYSCYGLAVEVYRRFGIDIPRTNIAVCACKQASQKEIHDHLQRFWEPAKTIKIPTGIIIESSHPGFANHIGVYIGNHKFIHVTLNHNVTISRISVWKSKIVGYYTYVGHAR